MMAGPQEPLPPGIVPNFHPSYPLEWRHKILPEPHPNELRSLGLPTSFSSYGRPHRGYGGYESCKAYNLSEKNYLEAERQAMQEQYFEELMLDQNRVQEMAGLQGMNGPPQHQPWQPLSNDRQPQQWQRQTAPYRHSNMRQNWTRGRGGHSRRGHSGFVDCSRQVNGRPDHSRGNISLSSNAMIPKEEVMMPSESDENCCFNNMIGYSDEYAAFDDDPDWSSNADEGFRQFSPTAPAPSSIDHYYNLAPQKPTEKRQNGLDDAANRKHAITRKLNYLRRQFRENVCDVCVVGFCRREQYSKHLRSHAKCVYPGCQFEACIEVLDGHITREHLLNPAVNSPISDEEYLRQRRNKFPTQAKNELDQAIVKLQKQRGELLGIRSAKARNYSGVGRSNGGGDVASAVKIGKRPPRCDEIRVPKKARVENSYKVNRSVWKRIPEFKGTDAFDEEMGIKSCFANTVETEDQLLSDVPAFNISDDEEEIYPPSCRSDVTFSSSMQAMLNQNHLGTEEIDSSTCSADKGEKTSARTVSNTVLDETGLLCGGALGLLMGDYGSASESEEEPSEQVIPHGPNLEIPITNYGREPFSRSTPRKCESAVDNGESNGNALEKGSADEGSEVKPKALDAEPEPIAKKKRRQRGGRGLKNRRNRSGGDDSIQINSSFEETQDSASPNTIASRSKEGAKSGVTSANIPGHRSSNSSRAPCPAGKYVTQPSLFPNLRPINVRKAFDEEADITEAAEPLHVRSEQALARKTVSQKYNNFRRKYRTSLLEKLLQNEVRFERNVLLQCARYIVENNFFEGGMKSGEITKEQSLVQDDCQSDSSDEESSSSQSSDED